VIHEWKNEFRINKINLAVDVEILTEILFPAPRFLPKLSHAVYGYWTWPSGRPNKLYSNMYCVLSIWVCCTGWKMKQSWFEFRQEQVFLSCKISR
jgi:hypothetical protein